MMCSFDGCRRPHYLKTFCGSHYRQWLARGKNMSSLTAVPPQPNPELDVYDYRFLTEDCRITPEVAARRLGLSAKTMVRRFQALGLAVPPGLHTAVEHAARRKVAS